MLEYALVEGFKSDLEFAETVWLEAMPARVYHTPQYGEVPMPVDKLERMVNNFKSNVRGQEIATNFDHGADKAKGNAASGWFKDFKVAPSSDDPNQRSLYAAVQFTDEAAKEIKDGKWKYFSLEWDDEWMDNTGSKHKDVVVGGAITNRPIAKHMASLPINFSESHWDSLTDEEKRDFNIKAFKSRMSKEAATVFGELVEQGIIEVTSESKEWEHSEPGISDPPPPRRDEDGSDDLAIREKWRRDPLPLEPGAPGAPTPNTGEGVNVLNEEQLKALRTALELPEDATAEKILEVATVAFSENKSLKDAVTAVGEEKKFAETYPQMWAEHQALKATNRENSAIAFSESVKQVTRIEGDKQLETDNGLSALALDKVKNVHKKFSEGSATVVDFEDAINTIMHGGIVDFAADGSSRQIEQHVVANATTAEGIAANRKAFAEKVVEIQTADKLKYEEAVTEAAKRYPDLAEAYRATARV